jgi:integrase
MPREKLTDLKVKALKPAPAGKRYDLMDAIVPGLGVRVTDKGQRTFVLVTRYPGSFSPTRRALGEYGKIGLEEARQKARHWHELISKGVDPAKEADRQRQAEAVKRENTFEAVAEEFLKRHVKGQRRGADVERDMRRELFPVWGTKPVTEISRRDVVQLVESIADRGATYQAHNVLGHVRTFFNWAINRGIYGLETSPCDRLKPATLIGEREPRQRVLSDAEIAALWRVAGGLAPDNQMLEFYPFGPLYRLLLLTGQRKSEVAGARWREIDLEKRLWTVPAERFKSNASHLVPLSDSAMDLLRALPRFSAGDYLFSSSRGMKPVAGFAGAKERLDAKMAEALGAAPDPFVVHDLRRTVRTHLSALRVAEPVAELVIGHARKGLARVYDQHRYLDEMREALDAWASRLRSIVDPPAANVVALTARR